MRKMHIRKGKMMGELNRDSIDKSLEQEEDLSSDQKNMPERLSMAVQELPEVGHGMRAPNS